ncbi:hypothetical protein Cal7507_1056 [Calothrix sp. PCC 7507]|nr:hypothetical protein Cal7507_1056 [Calothrix sp. PCC 7507]
MTTQILPEFLSPKKAQSQHPRHCPPSPKILMFSLVGDAHPTVIENKSLPALDDNRDSSSLDKEDIYR